MPPLAFRRISCGSPVIVASKSTKSPAASVFLNSTTSSIVASSKVELSTAALIASLNVITILDVTAISLEAFSGLNVAVGYPLYVTDIKPETNTIVLGEKDDLYKSEMWVKDYIISKYNEFPDNLEVITKIRYKNKGYLSNLKKINNKIKVTFSEKVSAIAPGQSAVFYHGDDVIGGGVIV